ncbi:MAG: hypothetical protein PVH91_13315 [Pseudomonadales bacterium]|jgi:hypothetical protein
MKQRGRVTFSQAGEIFEHSIEYLTHIRELLETLRDQEHPQRVKMLLDSFALEHRQLLGAIERYVEDADDRLLNTYSQYAVELPAELSGPDSPLTTLALTQWLQALNQHLASMFRELAETAKSAELRGGFDALTQQVESHERKLSKEYQRFEDL